MPFDPNNPPEKVKSLSPKKQRQWVRVFNSCWSEHADEARCHAMAWGAVKKSGRDWSKMCDRMEQRRDPDSIEHDEWILRQFRAAVADIEDAERIAMSLTDEFKAVKMKKAVLDFMGDMKRFRQSLGDFLKRLPAMVSNKRALAAFPELKDIILLNRELAQIARNTYMPEDALQAKMLKVVELDA